MVERKPWKQFPGAEQAVKIYARLRKAVSRRAKAVVVEEDEEDDKCECKLCLRSESKPLNRDIFAESKKLAELLNTLPQVDSPAPGSSMSPRTKRQRMPKPDVTVLHELGLCLECRVKCDICMPDVGRTRRFPMLYDGDSAQDLDKTIISKAAGKGKARI
jgi:hypothetical protein